LSTPDAKDFQSSLGLVKFISWSSLALILLVNLFLSVFISNFGRREVLARQQEFALLLAENLNHQIYQRFTLPTVIGFGRVELQRKEQYEQLEKVVTSTIHSFHVMEVRIFDFDNRVSFSTDKDIVGQTGYSGEAISEALKDGKSSFQLISRTGVFGGLFDLKPRPASVILRTTYPLKAEQAILPGAPSGFVMGALEFTQDITDDYWNVIKFQRIILASGAISSLALFFVLRMIISRAQRLNAQRIKDRAELERELQQQEKLAGMGRVVSGIAHEIRNPLGIIRSSAELLLKKAKAANDPNSRLLQAIFDESKRLSKTVGDFLDYARPKAPKQEPVDLAAVLDHALTFLDPKCAELKVAVSKDYAEGLAVRGDKDLVYRAFYNIISNSLDAMRDAPNHEGSKLGVAARRDGNHIEVVFTDNGPGFDPQTKDKLRDPFFTTKDTGTGLGLAIVSNILQSHEATFSLEEAAGGGARVVTRFPAA